MNTNEKLILIQSKLKLIILGIVSVVVFSLVAFFTRTNLIVLIIFMSLNAVIFVLMLLIILNIIGDLKRIDALIKEKAEKINNNIEKAISNNYSGIEDASTETGDTLDSAIADFISSGLK